MPMKYRTLCFTISILLLTVMFPSSVPAEETGKYWSGFFDAYYHSAQQCVLAGTVSAVTKAEALAQGKAACPVCVDDNTRYEKIESIVRGGTLVIRISDAWMRSKLDDASEITNVDNPRQAEYAGTEADAVLAEQLHGADYRAFLDAIANIGEAVTGQGISLPCVPDLELDGDALLMNRRHIGSAWYLTLRPNKKERKQLEKKKKLDVGLLLTFNQLSMRGGILSVGSRFEWHDRSRTVKPGKSKADPKTFSDGNVDLAVFREMDANICVIHLHDAGDDIRDTALWIDGADSGIRMNGYLSEGDAIFCCVLTDGEAAALKAGARFDVAEPGSAPQSDDTSDFSAAFASALATDTAETEAEPVSQASCASGLIACMDTVEYPLAPERLYIRMENNGVLRSYSIPGDLELWERGSWRSIARAWHYCIREADQLKGYIAGVVHLELPLNNLQPLTAGLYRVKVESREGGSFINADTWLEFRVSTDAAVSEPDEESISHEQPESFSVPEHIPAFAVDSNYNSCTDTTRRIASGSRTLVQAGDIVFELNGMFMDSWDWVPTRYWLSAYPAGHPEQVRMVLPRLDGSFCTLYDTGRDLLIWTDSEARLLRVNYDGTDLRRAEDLYDEPMRQLYDLLPVGDQLYSCDGEAVWRSPLSGGKAEKIYTADDRIRNSREGAAMVCANGVLYIADKGIVAVDTTDLQTTRLTDEYDKDSGDCGLGYILLGDELYTWSPSMACTIAIDVETGDIRKVSDTRFYFSQVSEGGIVLALTGKNEEGLFGGYDSADFYLPEDPAHPTFKPDECQKIAIEDNDFLLGDWLYQSHGSSQETVVELPW